MTISNGNHSFVRLVVATLSLIVTSGNADECHLCYREDRFISLPNNAVDTGGGVYTCQEMQTFASKGDFGPQSCAIAQVWATKECGCVGPTMSPASAPIMFTIPDNICSLCPFPDMIFGFPDTLIFLEEIGQLSCHELFQGAVDGFFTPYQCQQFQVQIAKVCGCRNNAPSPSPSNSLTPTINDLFFSPPPPTFFTDTSCLDFGEICYDASDCCSNRCILSSNGIHHMCSSKKSSSSTKDSATSRGGCQGGSRSGC